MFLEFFCFVWVFFPLTSKTFLIRSTVQRQLRQRHEDALRELPRQPRGRRRRVGLLPPAQAPRQGSVLGGGVWTVEGVGMDSGKRRVPSHTLMSARRLLFFTFWYQAPGFTAGGLKKKKSKLFQIPARLSISLNEPT